MKEKIILTYDGNFDYLFTIEKEQLKKAIEYKNNQRIENDSCVSDYELIIEYLDNNNVDYDVLCLMDIETMEW